MSAPQAHQDQPETPLINEQVPQAVHTQPRAEKQSCCKEGEGPCSRGQGDRLPKHKLGIRRVKLCCDVDAIVWLQITLGIKGDGPRDACMAQTHSQHDPSLSCTARVTQGDHTSAALARHTQYHRAAQSSSGDCCCCRPPPVILPTH
mgnify:CR=1 FL=1